MAELREPPETVEQFEKLSWRQKAEIKRKFPETYWRFIWQIRESDSKTEAQ